jgi:NAD(P)-dependent dehydrogenase (short-subunit alcohol dehydrogenase family)
MEIGGTVAIVTGSGAETGRAIALRLAAEGAAVLVADVDPAGGSETVRRVESTGARARFVEADVRVNADIHDMVSMAVGAFGGLDILVNNAGGSPEPHFPEASYEHWAATLDLNLRAPMLATQVALQEMRRRGAGAVVNIASTAALGYQPYDSPEYGAAKAGLVRFTSSLGSLRDRMNVRVNCLVPDWIGTERAAKELADMSPQERALEPRPLPIEVLTDAVVDLIRDDELAGRVMVMWREEKPRLLDPNRRE